MTTTIGRNTKVEAALAVLSDWIDSGDQSRVVTFAEIMERLGIKTKLEMYSVMSAVRHRLEQGGIHIVNVRGVGYKLANKDGCSSTINSLRMSVRRRSKRIVNVADAGYRMSETDGERSKFISVAAVFRTLASACHVQKIKRVESNISKVNNSLIAPSLVFDVMK